MNNYNNKTITIKIILIINEVETNMVSITRIAIYSVGNHYTKITNIVIPVSMPKEYGLGSGAGGGARLK